ncbi:MAG TPA: DUF1631 family protein, partial [Usitatibacter sp.]|nr:DUF1631 family protein [Usitatibacter sp.]
MSNVVPLGDHPRARARPSRKESADLLTGCRELAGRRMATALSGMLDRIEDDLFELAEKAIDRDAQNLYLDARVQARDKRAQIEAAFGQHFVEFFNRKVRGEAEATPSSDSSGELSLVGDQDLEERLAVREMSRKLQSACEGELNALSARVGYLLEKPELADEANPLSPYTVCAALKDACDQIQADYKVRMTLLRQFETYAQEALQRVYHELNSHLVALRVLPDVRPGIRRTPSSPAKPRKATGEAAAAAPAVPSAPAEGDILGALAQLLQGRSPAVAGHASATAPAGSGGAVPASGASAAWPTAPGGSAAPTVPASFVSELTRLHREPGEALAGSEEALMNVVRRIKAAPQSASLGTVDAMTIDIVAMLFDYIFEDPQIPASVKALLGRLQIPILKVALLDKSFFSSKAHAARRLIDLLAEASIGLGETGDRQAAALKMITEVVDTVLAEFDTDIALFERLAARVEAYIEAQKRAERDIVERSAKLIEEREREEVARAIAGSEIGRRLEARTWVPAPIRDMLSDAWVRALARVQRSEGEGSNAWHGLLRTMDDLLWSVEPKVSADDRKRLITMLPGMLRELQSGMELGQLVDEGRNAFLGALVDCHAQAVKAGMRGLAALPEAKPVTLPAAKAEIERAVIPAGDIRVEEIRLRSPSPSAVRNVFTRTGIWTNLQRGTWVEFKRDENVAVRSRLTWISPNKGVYLFTNPFEANTAISISPEALAEEM